MMVNALPSFGSILLLSLFLLTGPGIQQKQATAFVFAPQNSKIARSTTNTILDAKYSHGVENNDRRKFLFSILSTSTATLVLPGQAIAAKPKTRYVLDDETGDYIEVVDDGDWQNEWKSRYDQMSKMSKDEIFVAARGAGNVDSKDLANESPASKKRRAFSGCRDKGTREKLDNIGEKECSKRVLEGDYEFVLTAL
eukprot:CAMPEP_0116138736 /NCGR_PEP_ID=MMETSP0329-20121206/12936_1 /TAXON_ID=697910 /ORGANISM="Pseudo-nitzschia arenysensis, Strain B593" /LENGTH=195 /DNA_ID=CAMNT_0003633729 /DNA_START=110 /DNA_END=697 /DNA_ORIENTATION=-